MGFVEFRSDVSDHVGQAKSEIFRQVLHVDRKVMLATRRWLPPTGRAKECLDNRLTGMSTNAYKNSAAASDVKVDTIKRLVLHTLHIPPSEIYHYTQDENACTATAAGGCDRSLAS